jgi:hypothetical protein
MTPTDNVIRQGRNLMQQDGLRGNLQRQVRNTVQAAVPSVSDASRPSSRNNRLQVTPATSTARRGSICARPAMCAS